MLVLLTALGGCGKGPAREAERRSEGLDGGAAAGAAHAPRLEGAALEALTAQVKRQLREELRAEVTAELRRELAPLVRAELAKELRPAPDASAPSDGDAAEADATPREADAGAAPDGQAAVGGAPDAGGGAPAPVSGDIWSTPGTRIWPLGGGVKLVELVVGTALEDKLPADVKTHYPTTPEILYCYTVFENPNPETTVTHVWRRGSRLVSRVELEVGNSPKWRTWSKQRTQPHWTGLWSCEVLGPEGQQLGVTVFQIGG